MTGALARDPGSLRILAAFRHPTPYRDPLMDRVAALPGIDLEVLYLHEGFPQTPWEREALRHAHRFPRRFLEREMGGHEIAFHPGALARLASFRPHACILAAWSDPTMLALAAACRVLRIPYLLCSESFFESGLSGVAPWLRRPLRSAMIRGASAWLPTGTRARAWLSSQGADPARCHFFPTAPDARRWASEIDRLRATEPDLRAALGLPEDGVITFVGRLVDAKAPEILVDAYALLLDRGTPCRLVMVGDGPKRADLARHACAGRVDFRGFLQPRDVARMLAASDVFALPSRFETWGAAACEAMAAGLPAVLSDSVGSAPDLVGGLDAGAIVPANDAAALADALARLLAAPDRRTRLFHAARRRSIEWGHDLNLRSVVRALRDAGLPLHPATLALADAAIDAGGRPLEAAAA